LKPLFLLASGLLLLTWKKCRKENSCFPHFNAPTAKKILKFFFCLSKGVEIVENNLTRNPFFKHHQR